MQDIVAVMEAASSPDAVLVSNDSAAVAVLFATTSPDRVDGLVLINSYARLGRADDYPIGIPPSVQALYRQAIDDQHMELSVELQCRPRRHDAAFRSWHLKGLRRSASPSRALALTEQDFATDVRHLLGLVRAPTLVLHSEDDPYIRAAHGRYLAEHIPGARFVGLQGDGHHLATVDLDAVVEEIAVQFTGVRPQRVSDRVLATVLFTDIVDSTVMATRMGDRRWKAVLDRHDDLISRQLERFSGRLIKTTGDGAVATFDGPARAIACARAIRDGALGLDLDVRIGIHAGEVQLRGDDLSGIAVHVASRVQASAAPGEILVSRTIVDLVAGSGVEFQDRGEHQLKGLSGDWQLFALEEAFCR